MNNLLPNECPNCGRLFPDHNFDENPGPVQTKNQQLTDELDLLRNLYDELFDQFKQYRDNNDAENQRQDAEIIRAYAKLSAADEERAKAEAENQRLRDALERIAASDKWGFPYSVAREALAGDTHVS